MLISANSFVDLVVIFVPIACTIYLRYHIKSDMQRLEKKLESNSDDIVNLKNRLYYQSKKENPLAGHDVGKPPNCC